MRSLLARSPRHVRVLWLGLGFLRLAGAENLLARAEVSSLVSASELSGGCSTLGACSVSLVLKENAI